MSNPCLIIRSTDGVTHVRFRDARFSPIATPQIEQELRTLVEQTDRPRIVLDLFGVDTISSTGLGMLVSILMTVRHHGGKLRLANLDPGLREVMTAAHLDRVLTIDETLQDAIDKLR